MQHATALEFNALTGELITKFERKSRSDTEIANLDRLKKRIKLLNATLGQTSLISLAAPFFIKYSEMILEPNIVKRDKYFSELDARTEYFKHCSTIDKQDEFIFALSDSIRLHYTRSERLERDTIHAKLTSMLRCAVEYQMTNTQ